MRYAGREKSNPGDGAAAAAAQPLFWGLMPRRSPSVDRLSFEADPAHLDLLVGNGWSELARAVVRQAARDALGLDGAGELMRVDARVFLADYGPFWLDELGMPELDTADFVLLALQDNAGQKALRKIPELQGISYGKSNG